MAATNKSTAKKTSAAKTNTNTKTNSRATQAPKSKAAASKQSPRLYERDPKLVAQDAGYAAAAVAHDTFKRTRALPSKVDELRKDAPNRVKQAPERTRTLLDDLRGQVVKQFDARTKTFEKTFDSRAKEGRKVAEPQLKNVLDQAGNTRSKIKSALTSVGRTATTAVDAGVDAGRKQADVAKGQVKAATTSARKTADSVEDLGDDIAS